MRLGCPTLIPRDLQVADAVRAHARHAVRALARRLHVAEPPSSPGLGAVERGHRAGEVVGLRSEDRVQRNGLIDLERARTARRTRLEVGDLVWRG